MRQEKINERDRIRIREDAVSKEVYELSQFYSLKQVFDVFPEENVRSFSEESKLTRKEQIRVLWPQSSADEEVNRNNPLLFKESYWSWFLNGGKQANKFGRVYADYLISGCFMNELNRMRTITEILLANLNNAEIEEIKTKITDFLSVKELNIENSVIKGSLGYWEEIDRKLKNKKVGRYISIKQRFEIVWSTNPIDAAARLLICLITGGYVHHCIDIIFPIGLDEEVYSNQIDRDSNDIYLQYKDCYKNYRDIYEQAVAAYRNNNRSLEIYYVLGFCAKRNFLAPGVENCWKTAELEKEDCLEKCISLGMRSKESEGISDLIRKRYQKCIGEAAYELFSHFLKKEIYDESEKYFKIACDYNSDALCICGDLYSSLAEQDSEYMELVNEIRIHFVGTYEENLDYAEEQYEKAGNGYGYYKKALCLEKQSQLNSREINKEEILECFVKAQNLGYKKARAQLVKRKHRRTCFKSNDTNIIYKKVCFLIDLNDANCTFALSLPFEDGWKINLNITSIDNEEYVKSFENSIQCAGGNVQISNQNIIAALEELDVFSIKEHQDIVNVQTEKVLIAALGENKEQNVHHIGRILEYCYWKQEQYNQMNIGDEYYLSDRIMLLGSVNSDEVELHIDRLQSEFGDFYIPVKCCVYEKEASKELLTKLPLFAPLISKDFEQQKINVMILGSDSCVVQLIKDIISVSCFCYNVEEKKKNLSLCIVDRNVAEVKNTIYKDCSKRLFYGNDSACTIDFIESDIDCAEFYDLFTGKVSNVSDNLKILQERLAVCDYFICAGNIDRKNIANAKLIRQYTIRNIKIAKKYFELPQIAVLCRNNLFSEDINKLSVGNISYCYDWYESYQLVGFGSYKDYVSYDNLVNDWVEKWSLVLQLSYYSSKNKHIAFNDYYSKEYNRDSSLLSALYFMYRFYSVGVLADMRRWDYDEFVRKIIDNTILKRYDKLIENPLIAEEQAKLEHIRWNHYMLSRGWEPVSMDQVEQYMSANNPTHQLYIAKLHPYIASWEELGVIAHERTWLNLQKIKYGISKILQEMERDTKWFPNEANLTKMEMVIGYKKELENLINSMEMYNHDELIDKLKQNQMELNKIKGSFFNESHYLKELGQICENLQNQIDIVIGGVDNEETGIQKEIGRIRKKYLNKKTGSLHNINWDLIRNTTTLIRKSQEII